MVIELRAMMRVTGESHATITATRVGRSDGSHLPHPQPRDARELLWTARGRRTGEAQRVAYQSDRTGVDHAGAVGGSARLRDHRVGSADAGRTGILRRVARRR